MVAITGFILIYERNFESEHSVLESANFLEIYFQLSVGSKSSLSTIISRTIVPKKK